METLKINLRKVSPNNFDETFRAIIRIIKMSDYCRLKEFCLIEGGVQVDEYLPFVEELCYFLKQRAGKLVKLHLPVASNSCLTTISAMPSLQCLVIERTSNTSMLVVGYKCFCKLKKKQKQVTASHLLVISAIESCESIVGNK